MSGPAGAASQLSVVRYRQKKPIKKITSAAELSRCVDPAGVEGDGAEPAG